MPKYSIHSIYDLAPEQGKCYFFDANTWLFQLRPPANLKNHEKIYVDFFDSIINLASNQKVKNPPKIMINNLLVSEVFNAYIRLAFELYKEELPSDPKNTLTASAIKSLDLKRDYRETNSYEHYVSVFRDDILSYKDYIEVHEFSKEIDTFYLINNFTSNVDFNDYCYYEFCLEKKAVLVTHDSDFLFQGIEIITGNGKLLKHS